MEKLHTDQVDELFEAILSLKTVEECYKFFEDACTIKEVLEIAQRLKAARIANLRRVPCVLHDIDMPTALIYSIIENLQRTNVSFFEEAESIKEVMGKYSEDTFEVENDT